MKNGYKNLIAFVLAALMIYGAATAFFQFKNEEVRDLYRKNMYSGIAFEAKQYVAQIENGLLYGKQLDHYFGIEKLLNRCFTSSSYIRGVYLFDLAGTPLYHVGEQETAVPNASAAAIGEDGYAVRMWGAAEYIIINIAGASGAAAGKLMLKVDSAALENAIAAQSDIAMWQTVAIAAMAVLLAAILSIAQQQRRRALLPVPAMLRAVCCAIGAVAVDAIIQNIRFVQIATASTEQAAQRVVQVVQQQVDTLLARGVGMDAYDINGYLLRLKEGMTAVGSLQINENGAVTAQVAPAAIEGFTTGFRRGALQFLLLAVGIGLALVGAALLLQLFQNRRGARGSRMAGNGLDTKLVARARRMLAQKPAQYAFLSACLDDGFVDEIVLGRGGLRLHDRVGGCYLFAAETAEEFLALYTPIQDTDEPIFLADGGLEQALAHALASRRVHVYVQRILDQQVPLHPVDIQGVEFRPLEQVHIPEVFKHYRSNEFSRAYTEACVLEQSSMGAFKAEDGTLVGFTLSHYNGEVGPSWVAPEYRGKGLGLSLLVRITKLQRVRNRPGFCFAKEENLVSQNMCKRAGYERTGEPVMFLYREQ